MQQVSSIIGKRRTTIGDETKALQSMKVSERKSICDNRIKLLCFPTVAVILPSSGCGVSWVNSGPLKPILNSVETSLVSGFHCLKSASLPKTFKLAEENRV
jgi:hypothetical protein